MKHIFSILGIFCFASAMACGIHQFKVPLNQRGFYNPAAICPYCQGSAYLATGAFAGLDSDEFGLFITAGHDGDNAVHGAWDLTYSYSSGSDYSMSAYSTRYAWKQDIGSWKLAAGMRASWMNYTLLKATPESYVSKSTRSCFNFDAGVMVTDEKGFYAGVSVLNLLQPKLVFGFESPGTTEIYSLQTEQSYVAATGGLVGLNRHFDLMLDASASVSRGVQCVRPSAMVRFNHKIAIGSAVTIDSGSEPVYEVQGGYTSTPFKWLNTVSFTANGIVVETGVVVRFGVQRWRVTRLPVPCTTTPIPEPPRTEFSPSE